MLIIPGGFDLTHSGSVARRSLIFDRAPDSADAPRK